MRMLRLIKGVTLGDRGRRFMGDLEVKKSKSKARKQARLRWYGHILRIDEDGSESYTGEKKTNNEVDGQHQAWHEIV